MKRLLYILLGLLGLSSCEHFFAVEYGVPHVSFSLKARVVDEAGAPIQGIEVRTEEGERFEYKTGFSDYQGNIDAYGAYFWPGVQNQKVQFIDVDGEANGGEFETLTLQIENVTQTEKGSGNWYDGAYTADLGTVTMKLKQQNEEAPDETPEETPAE